MIATRGQVILMNLDELIRQTWPNHLSLLLLSRREAGSWPVALSTLGFIITMIVIVSNGLRFLTPCFPCVHWPTFLPIWKRAGTNGFWSIIWSAGWWFSVTLCTHTPNNKFFVFLGWHLIVKITNFWPSNRIIFKLQ